MDAYGKVMGTTHTISNQSGEEGVKRRLSEAYQIPADGEDSRLRTWTSAAEFPINAAYYGNVRVLMLIHRVSQIPD